MKIAKYLILLLLLLCGTISVFVATKDGSYYIEKSKIIDVPRDIVYKYAVDKSNWDSINPWKKESFKILNRETNPEEGVQYKVLLNDVENLLKLEIKDTLKKQTIVIWSTSGKQTFRDKLLSLIGKGTKNDFGDRFEEALLAVNNTLTREINSYNIQLNGFVKKDTIFYIQKPIASKLEEIPSKIKSNLPQLQQILSSTNTASKGDPFLVYHSKDTINNKYVYSIAIPIATKIYTSADSDIITGQINPHSTVKATLKGNYNHKPEVYQQLRAFMAKNNLEQSLKYKEIEVITNNAATHKLASQWVTEIYFPVKPKVVYKPKVTKVENKDSLVQAIVKDILSADKKKK